jgi:hypothetical protein
MFNRHSKLLQISLLSVAIVSMVILAQRLLVNDQTIDWALLTPVRRLLSKVSCVMQASCQPVQYLQASKATTAAPVFLPATLFQGVTAGEGIALSGPTLSPVITNTGVLSVQGQTGAITLTGTGISIAGTHLLNTGVLSLQGVAGNVSLTGGDGVTVTGTTITNAGVLSVQGQTGAVSLTGGTGISVSGTTISNTGVTSLQGQSGDVSFTAGSGITITGTTISSQSQIQNLTTNGVVYASGSSTLASLTPGTAGFVLASNGPSQPPSWVASSLNNSFAAITSDTNTQAAMLVGTGASLDFSGTGTINASSLLGSTWAAPGAIGTGTPTTGAFTSLSGTSITGTTFNGLTITNTGSNTLTIATGKSLTVSTTLTLSGTDGTSFTLPSASDTLVGRTSTDTLTNKTIAAGSNTITGLTNSNLSGSAGISNGNLANSSVTVTAGTGLSGGGSVSLGSSVTLNNAGVLSLTSTQATVSAATGNVTISLPQNIDTNASPTFAGVHLTSLTNQLILGNGNIGTLTLGSLTANRTYTLPDSTGTICLVEAGNCAGSGTGVTTAGGSTNRSAKFTASQAIGNGSISDQYGGGVALTIDSSGNLAGIGTLTGLTGLSSSGTITFSGIGGVGIVHSNSSGVLSASAVALGGSEVSGTLGVGNGGTGAGTAATARSNLGAAAAGPNSDITSLSGLTTALSVGQGGTGVTSLTTNGLLYGGNSVGVTSAGTSGQLLVGNTLAAPSFVTLGGDATLNSGTGALTLASVGSANSYGSSSQVPVLTTDVKGRVTGVTNTSIAIAASAITSGTLPITRGGTNTTSLGSAGSVVYSNGSAYAFTSVGSSNQVLFLVCHSQSCLRCPGQGPGGV